jgi:uncharacterized membrane protein (DUF2068 family)
VSLRGWNPETFTCAFEGHAAPAMESRLPDPDWLLAVPVEGGGLAARCLRCDTWVLTDPARATRDQAPSLQEVEIPLRGKALRDSIVLKVIAVDRAIHAFLFTIVAVVALLLETHLPGVQRQARHLLDAYQNGLSGTGQGASHSFLVRELEKLLSLKRHGVNVIFFIATAYAVVEGMEAYGLWRARRWAEYLTALATAGFLPLEIHELTKSITVGRVIALVVNVGVLVYLVWAKRLFGIRGGEPTDERTMEAAEVIRRLPGQPVP